MRRSPAISVRTVFLVILSLVWGSALPAGPAVVCMLALPGTGVLDAAGETPRRSRSAGFRLNFSR